MNRGNMNTTGHVVPKRGRGSEERSNERNNESSNNPLLTGYQESSASSSNESLNLSRRNQGPPGPNRTRNKGLFALNSPRNKGPPGNRTRNQRSSGNSSSGNSSSGNRTRKNDLNNENSHIRSIYRLLANVRNRHPLESGSSSSSREKSRSQSHHRGNENNRESLLARLAKAEQLTRLALSRLHPDNRSEILSKVSSVKPVKMSVFVSSRRMRVGRLTNPINKPSNVLTLFLNGEFLGQLKSKVTLPQLCTAMANFTTEKGRSLEHIEIGMGAIIKALGDTKQPYFGGMSILQGPYHPPWRYGRVGWFESDEDPHKLILGIRQKDNKDRETVLSTPSIFSIQIYHANEAYGRLSFIFPLFTLLIKGILLNGESTQSPGIDLYEIINDIVKNISFYENNETLKQIQGYITTILSIKFNESTNELDICGVIVELTKLNSLNSMARFINDILKQLFGENAIELKYGLEGDYLMIKMSEFNATFLLFYLADGTGVILRLSNTLYVLNMLGIVEKGHDFSDKDRTVGLDCIPARDALTEQLSATINISKQVHLIKKKVTYGEGDDKTTFYAYLISGPINRMDDFTFTCSSKPELGTSRSIGFDIQIGHKGFTFETCDFPDHDCIATIEPVRKLDKPCELFPPSDDGDAMRTYQSLDGVITHSHGPRVEIPSLEATLNLVDGKVYNIKLDCMSDTEPVTHQLPTIIFQNEAHIYHIRGFCVETNEIIEIDCGTDDFESFKICMLHGVLIIEDRPPFAARTPLSNRPPIQKKNLTIIFPKVVETLREQLLDILLVSDNVKEFREHLKTIEHPIGYSVHLDTYMYEWLQRIINDEGGNNPTPYGDQIDELRKLSYNSKKGEVDRGSFTECQISDPANLELLPGNINQSSQFWELPQDDPAQQYNPAATFNAVNIGRFANIGTGGSASDTFASGLAGPSMHSPVKTN